MQRVQQREIIRKCDRGDINIVAPVQSKPRIPKLAITSTKIGREHDPVYRMKLGNEQVIIWVMKRGRIELFTVTRHRKIGLQRIDRGIRE